ncbi:MAG: FecR domain-containing protein [bacterium]
MVDTLKLGPRWLIPLILLLLFGPIARGFPFPSGHAIGKIVPLEGLVVVRRQSEGITVKPPAMILHQGDDVLTNETGSARILLSGGNEVFVGPSSTLYLNKTFQSRYNYEYNLNLKGKLRAKVQRVRGRRFQIKTSSAVIDVKGTDFIVESGLETTQVSTFNGLVQLTALKTKQQVDISPGLMSSVSVAGEVSKPEKVVLEVVKGLEKTGKTGIQELDRVMEPPPPLDPAIILESVTEPRPGQAAEPEKKVVVQEKPVSEVKTPVMAPPAREVKKVAPAPEEAPSIWAYAEEYRTRNRLGVGFGVEIGAFTGSFLFLEYNLTERSQLHYQYVDSIYQTEDESPSVITTELERKLNAITYRRFFADSGIYLGAGFGTSQFKQRYTGRQDSVAIQANGSFLMAELGAQTYGEAFQTTFYVSVGTQFLFYSGLHDEYRDGSVSDRDYDDFTQRAKNSLDAILIAFGWFF